MRRSSSFVNAKGIGPRKRSSQQLAGSHTRTNSLLNGVLVLGVLAVLLLFWRVAGYSGRPKLAAGQALFLHGGADLGSQEQGVQHDGSARAMFAGQAQLHPHVGEMLQSTSLQDRERARASVAEAAAAPAQVKSLGYYWGIRGEATAEHTATSGVSLQHLQKVAGEAAKQKAQGKTSSGFYFSHDIPDNLKAESESGANAASLQPPQHRKDLKAPPKEEMTLTAKEADAHPLGYYFQKDAHKGGLTGASAEAGEGMGPDNKPLKYYFTKDIPDDAKRQLAFKAMMKAEMLEGVEHHPHRFAR